jgi:hypothetical protein
MLIKSFKKSGQIDPLILVLVALLLWIDGFLFFGQHHWTVVAPAPLYQVVLPFVSNFPLLQVVLAFLLLLLQAFMINHVTTSKGLMERHTLLPALIYVVLMSSDFNMLALHPVLIANFFLILAINKIFDTFSEKDVPLEVFNVGFLVALAGLFYYPAMLFFFLAVVALFVYMVGNIRGIMATFIGFLTPLLFLFVFFYLTDQLQQRLDAIFSYPQPFLVFYQNYGYYSQAFILVLAGLAFFSFLSVLFGQAADKPVRIRKRFVVLVWFFAFALLSALVATGFFEVHYAMMLIPLSVFIAVFFMEMKKPFWAELSFSLLVLLIIVGKLARLD